MRLSARTVAAAWLGGLALAACKPAVEAPADRGVCWHMVVSKAKTARFYRLADHVPDLEHCAGNLEMMRRRFLSLGGSTREVDGAYQGQFLFLDASGVYTSSELNGTPYLVLKPSGDGQLVPPGAVLAN